MNTLKQSLAVAVISLCTASLTAQNFIELPSTAQPSFELSNFSLVPFMQPNARVQMFYGSSEVGLTPFVANEIAFRFDGPIPQVGAPGPFTIQQLILRIGTTSVATPGSDFAANLTSPLTEVFNGPWTYWPDNGSAAPHPWGGPNNGLLFPFTNVAPIAMNPGEWLVVDLTMIGNNIQSFGFAHAILDGAATTGGVSNGTAVSFGSGCATSAGQPAAAAAVVGTMAPGGTHFLTGTNLGANALVLGMYGLDNSNYVGVPLPFTLPGSSCDLLTSIEATLLTFADAAGSVSGTELALSLPANPALSGVQVYEQLASLVPTANVVGLVFSDAVGVTLGSFGTLGRQTYSVAHDTDAAATYANSLGAFGYAMRLGTL